jgi:hypothetical protein
MKKIFKIIIWIALFLAVIFLLLNIAIALFGKAIVAGQIEKNLKLKAKLESMSISFPLSVNIRNLDIQGLAKIDSLSARPSILGFLAGKVVLNELTVVRPKISVEMDSNGKLNLPAFSAKGKQPPILLAGLKVKEGSLIFIDKKVDPAGYKIMVNNINADIAKATFPPTSLFTRFNLSAFLVDNQNAPKGKAAASGWIDFGPKNMEGRVELKDIDVTYLAPYYQTFSPAKKLASGKLNFTSDLKAENNDLIGKCHLEVVDLVYEKETPAEGQPAAPDLAASVLNMLSGNTGKIAFDFTLKTKLDNPKINLKDLQGMFAQSAIQNIVNQPPENIIKNAKDLEKQFKDFGKTMKEMWKKKEEAK